jgi:hypothetical protein
MQLTKIPNEDQGDAAANPDDLRSYAVKQAHTLLKAAINQTVNKKALSG